MVKIAGIIFGGVALFCGVVVYQGLKQQDKDRQACAAKGLKSRPSPDSRSLRLVCVDGENRMIFPD